jgi:Mg2+-importing ATPase
VSTSYEVDGRVLALDGEARARCVATYEGLGARGYRVLAVAYARVERRPFSKTDEHDLVLAGFLAFLDPPREDAHEVIAALRKEGVHIKVITGDSDLVAAHVCERVGISTKHLLLGSQIDKMSDPALAHRAERTQVFARVTPAQKSRILRALRARGHVVGFLGDGINDAPSLHSADVGISVSSAVDVAKDAADIILLEPGLRVLLTGVLEGRRAFGNVMKYLLMGTSSNFGNMFSMAGAAVFLPFLPMLPTQILLNNFLYDIAQITIPSDNVDAHFVRKPRHWDIGLIRRFMLTIGPLSSLYDFVTFFVLLQVFKAPEALFHTGWFVESLATQTLVIFVIRTAASPFRSRPSRALLLTTLGIVALAVALPYLPGTGLLGFVPLPPAFFGFLVIATVTYLALVEIVKRRLFRRALA